MPSAAFLTELEKLKFQGNIVLEIAGDYYSQYQPDSGLVIDSDKVGLISRLNISGVKFDIRNVQSTITSVTFSLLDKDGVVTALLASNQKYWQSEEVKVYFGFITGSFDWADYEELSTSRINSLRKRPNQYEFTAQEPTSLLKVRGYATQVTLQSDITDTATTLSINEETTEFPSTGIIKLNDEFMTYSSKTLNSFSGLGRGHLSSQAAAHQAGDLISNVTLKEDNAMDMLLGIFTDLGISSGLVDTTAFTDLRDGPFTAQGDFKLYLYDIDDMLSFIEKEILEATNTRLFVKSGKISIAILDQFDYSEPIPTEGFTEDHIRSDPSFDLDTNRLVNSLIFRWDWIEGEQRFARTSLFEDADSIAAYGERKPLEFEFKGIVEVNGGGDIISDRANRLLARLSTPQARISFTTHWNRFLINPGDTINLEHRYLPAPGGGLGIDAVLEVLSKEIQSLESDARVRWELAFTSFSGLRIGLISPSPLPVSVTSQSVFEVPDGACYRAGYFLKLWDDTTQSYFADSANEIESVVGNIITMKNPWTTTLNTSTTRIFFADYDESSSAQKARYAYIAPDTNVFASDNGKAYEILV